MPFLWSLYIEILIHVLLADSSVDLLPRRPTKTRRRPRRNFRSTKKIDDHVSYAFPLRKRENFKAFIPTLLLNVDKYKIFLI